MEHTYWHKQTAEQPIFPDLQWSRPENRANAGKLLIVGGNAYGFAAPAEAFAAANSAGIGTARVLLPDALRTTVGRVFAVGEYAPSTPSGSFGQQALAELLAMAHWADGVLLPGDLGRNSETAILLEKFLVKHSGLTILTKDAADYISAQPQFIAQRPATVLILSFSQLQKMAVSLHYPKAFTFEMGLVNLVTLLHELTQSYPMAIVTKHVDNFIVAEGGEVSTTKLTHEQKIWRLQASASASVWAIQNPTKLFAALCTAVHELPGVAS